MLDRRERVRDKVIFGAVAGSDKTAAKVSCVVRNISASGANVEFPGAAQLPDNISLSIPKTGRAFLAKIVWWRANRAGIVFQSANEERRAAPASDLEERLRISERKARALKQRVRQLLGEA